MSSTTESTNAQLTYELQGEQLKIVYSTSGFDGKAHFAYQGSDESYNFAGTDIDIIESQIGTQITVFLGPHIDVPTHFTLLVPGDQHPSFRTIGITTRNVISTQTRSYEVIHLNGTVVSDIIS